MTKAMKLCLVLLAVATLAPLWAGKYLPLLDVPNHLSAISIWHYYDSAAFDFSKHYTLNLVPLPYWLHYYSVHLLCYVFDVHVANKLYLSLYALALPAGVLVLARRHHRSPWLTLFAFPLVWNFNLAEGFIAYVTGVALLPFAILLVERDLERPTLARGVSVVLAGALIYFSHLIPFLLFALFATALLLWYARPPELARLPQRAWPLALVAVGAGTAYWYSNSMRFHRLRGTGDRAFVHLGADDKLRALTTRLLSFLRADTDELVLVVLLVTWIALLITAQRRNPSTESSAPRRAPVIELCAALALVAYIALPRSMKRPFYWYMIDGRVVVVIALFAILLVRGTISGARRWLFVPVAIAVLVYDAALFTSIRAFNRRVAGFDAIADKIPLHVRTLTLVMPPRDDPDFNTAVMNQWPSYTQIRRGGYNYYNFKEGFPLKYRHLLPAPLWDAGETFHFATQGQAWDYFLTLNEGARDNFTKPHAQGLVALVAEDGPWRLWKRIGAPASQTLPEYE